MENLFKYVDANTPNCKVFLLDETVRRYATDYDLVHHSVYSRFPDDKKRQQKTAIPLGQMINLLDRVRENFNFGPDEEEYEKKEQKERSLFNDLLQSLEASRSALREFYLERAKGGLVSFEAIPFIFTKDSLVSLGTGAHAFGAKVLSVELHKSFFGVYYAIAYRFVRSTGTQWAWATGQEMISAFSGELAFSQLGIVPMSPEHKETFKANGARFFELTAKPQYLTCKGNLTRKNYFSAQSYRAHGRCMIDQRAMEQMDTNYRSYHGGDNYDEEGSEAMKFTQIEQLKTNDAVLCTSPYVYGFSFHSKVWGEFLLNDLFAIEFRKDAFDKLVLEQERKDLIEALVSHQEDTQTDLIDGKGGGCIFLLHGVPGVGKTLTAEAIADRLERPLYMVGAGELGVTPSELEDKLKDILDTAHAWGALLLIDEADIFLERRANSDVQRNAMVGIFLRLLEYYQGILFLTTNRVGDIDEAFLSRISVGLHYRKLSSDKVAQVWRNLLVSVKGFDHQTLNYDQLSELELNGRQIKHAIRLALVLAKSKGRLANMADLVQVAKMTQEFKASVAELAKTDSLTH